MEDLPEKDSLRVDVTPHVVNSLRGIEQHLSKSRDFSPNYDGGHLQPFTKSIQTRHTPAPPRTDCYKLATLVQHFSVQIRRRDWLIMVHAMKPSGWRFTGFPRLQERTWVAIQYRVPPPAVLVFSLVHIPKSATFATMPAPRKMF